MNIILEINGKIVHSKVKEWTLESIMSNEILMMYVDWGLKNKSIKSLTFSELD
jgi:hypothetical protein